MSGPQGSDTNPGAIKPASGADQPSAAAPSWQQPGRGPRTSLAARGRSSRLAAARHNPSSTTYQPPAPQGYHRSTAGRPGLQPAGVRAARGTDSRRFTVRCSSTASSTGAGPACTGAVPAARQPGQYPQAGSAGQYPGYIPPGAEEGAKTSRRTDRRDPVAWCAAARRAVGAGLLEAGFFVTTKLGRPARPSRVCANPHRQSKWLRREERQGRQSATTARNPTVKGTTPSIARGSSTGKASGDGDVPGRQGHRTRSAGPSRGAASSDNRGPRSSCSRDSRLRGRRTGIALWVSGFPGRHCCCCTDIRRPRHVARRRAVPDADVHGRSCRPARLWRLRNRLRNRRHHRHTQAGVGSASGHSHGGVGFQTFSVCGHDRGGGGLPMARPPVCAAASRSSTSCPPPDGGPIVSSFGTGTGSFASSRRRFRRR